MTTPDPRDVHIALLEAEVDRLTKELVEALASTGLPDSQWVTEESMTDSIDLTDGLPW